MIYQQGVTNAFVTGYTGTSDTHLDPDEPDFNFGAAASTSYRDDARVGLLRFDLSSFAGNYARITSISLGLHISSTVLDTVGDLSAYAVAAANVGWVAGTGPANGAARRRPRSP